MWCTREAVRVGGTTQIKPSSIESIQDHPFLRISPWSQQRCDRVVRKKKRLDKILLSYLWDRVESHVMFTLFWSGLVGSEPLNIAKIQVLRIQFFQYIDEIRQCWLLFLSSSKKKLCVGANLVWPSSIRNIEIFRILGIVVWRRRTISVPFRFSPLHPSAKIVMCSAVFVFSNACLSK